MTEITITNIEDHHKGRVDVFAQYPNNCGLFNRNMLRSKQEH